MTEKLAIEEYKSNSNTSKEKAEAPKKVVKRVVKGPVKTRKKPLGKRFTETFLSDEVGSVKSYLFFDVLIPSLKETIFSLFRTGLEMALFGGTQRNSNVSRYGGSSFVSYDKIGRRDPRVRERDRSRPSEARYNRRVAHDFKDIIFQNRQDAEEVLNSLVELTLQYDEASIADLNELASLESNYTDTSYGWDDLGSARVIRVREGYILDLPTPVAL